MTDWFDKETRLAVLAAIDRDEKRGRQGKFQRVWRLNDLPDRVREEIKARWILQQLGAA